MIAGAFLKWQRTWNRDSLGNVSCDYLAATQIVKIAEVEKKHIDTLYIMKVKWLGAQNEQKS